MQNSPLEVVKSMIGGRPERHGKVINLAEVRLHVGMFFPSFIPLLDLLLDDFEMFRVRHGRVTSLASALLR